MNLNKLTFIICCLFTTFSFSQITFEKSYILFDSGARVDCYIQDLQWLNTPKEFKYKMSLDSDQIMTAKIDNVKEFGIKDHTKYVKHTVDYDISSNDRKNLSHSPEPEFVTRTLFLKQLVEGKANLFEYQDNRKRKFFYSIDNIEIKELILKEYLSSGSVINVNERYKKQLYDNLKCGKIEFNDLKSLDYDKMDLVKFFTLYNNCNNGVVKVYNGVNGKGKFNFSFKLGYFRPSVEIKVDEVGFTDDRQSASLGKKAAIRIGAEVEYILPFNNNKWGVFIEPAYQFYNDKKTYDTGSAANFTQTVTVDYKFVDFPLGLRHYMYLNNNSKVFLSAAMMFTFDLSEKIDYEDDSEARDLRINSGYNFALGFGYEYANKYNLELRYITNRNLTTREASIARADYSTGLGIVLGYKFL